MNGKTHSVTDLFRGLEGSAHGGADGEHDDFLRALRDGVLICLLELNRSGQSGGGHHRVFFDALIKSLRGDVDAVAEGLVAPDHQLRDDGDAVLLDQFLGNVAGAVRHQCN